MYINVDWPIRPDYLDGLNEERDWETENHFKWSLPEQAHKNYKFVKCFHKNCPECKGTGRKGNGQNCIHMISCPCPNCSLGWL